MTRYEGNHSDVFGKSVAHGSGKSKAFIIRQSPIRLVAILALFVFTGEAAVMLILNLLPETAFWLEAIFDATLLVILLAPVLYFLVFRPFVHHLTELNRAEKSLVTAHRELEQRVEERTTGLVSANKKLKRAIEARIMAEKSQRVFEQKYRFLVENLQEGIWFIDQEAYSTYVNPRMAEMLGYTVAEMQGKHLFYFMDERGVEISKRNLDRREQGIQEQHDFELLHKNGNRIYTSMETAPITDENGNYIGALASVANITQRKQAERKLQQRTHDLGERVKELNCLYGISHLVEKHGHSLKKIYQGTADLIPPSWQYPEITCARIMTDNQEYKTKNFIETKWKQTSKISVKGNLIGSVEVFYLEEKLQLYEGPFLKEELSLIDAIASRLGHIIERINAEEELKLESDVNAVLSELYEPLISPAVSIADIANTVLGKARGLTKSKHGFVSSIDPGTMDNVSHTLSEMLKGQCKVTKDKGIAFPLGEDGRYGGLWGHALNSMEPFFTNSPQNHRAATGLPEGHIPLQRFLSVPVMLGKELVGQISLANKDEDYTQRDLQSICRVANFYALAIQRSRTMEALHKAKDELEKRVVERTKTLMLTNMQLKKEVEDRKIAEAQLQRSKTMLQAVFNGIADPLILIDKQCRVKIINSAATRYYGMENPGNVVGNYCYQVFKGRPQPCDGCDIPKAVLQGQSVTFERKGFMDSERLEQVVIYRIKEKFGEVGDAIISITDITETRKFERRLMQSEKMASLGVLVTSIAHEINNPNSFISFNVPILRDYIHAMIPIIDEYAAGKSDLELCNMTYPEFRKDIDKLLDNIEHGSGRINSAVSNLREFSLEKEKKPLKRIDIAEVIERALVICQNKIKKNVESIDKTIPQNLAQIYTDPYALEQILINLLINAAQAADKQDSRVKLEVSVGKGGNDHTTIEVSDNGCGMDERTQLKIFDPFFTTKSPAEGTGLGLYVCHNLIADLGGRIEVESEPGTGSTFTVILPYKEPAAT